MGKTYKDKEARLRKLALPRAPLPKQVGGAHKDKKKSPKVPTKVVPVEEEW